jgi:hypothetical protein
MVVIGAGPVGETSVPIEPSTMSTESPPRPEGFLVVTHQEGAANPVPRRVWIWRRHRATIIGVLVLAAAVTALLSERNVSGSVGTGAASSTAAMVTASGPPPGSVRVIRVDRAGTGLTVRVNSDVAKCLDYPDARVTVTETATTVVLTTSPGTPVRRTCTAGGLHGAIVYATLHQPLGPRTVRDDHGVTVLAVRDADLPVVPPPWQEVAPTDAVWTGHEYFYYYARPRGPEIGVYVGDAAAVWVPETGDSTIRLGPWTGQVTVSDGNIWGVRWQVGDLTYTLDVFANQTPASAGEAGMRAVVARLIWP